MAIQYKPKLIIALLAAAVIIPIFSYFVFYQIESIIHGDLYNYGLLFNNNWADKYSFYASLYMFTLFSTWAIFGSAIVSFLSYDIGKNNRWRSICISLLVLGVVLTIFNIYFSYRIDFLVNHELNLYGLRFSDNWYSNYSLTINWSYFLFGLECFFALTAVVLLVTSTRKKKRVPARLYDSIFIAIGTAILALSIIYSQSILALIGLGLLFWGVTFTYITTSDYVKKILLDTVVKSQQTILNRIVQKLQYRGDTIYLPPQFFKTSNTYKAYISKDKLERIPTAEMLPKQKPDLIIDYIDNRSAILITPPGVELAQLFEEYLEKDLASMSLKELQMYLPELLIEDLEVTNFFDMQIEDDLVHLQIDDSNFRYPRAETELSSLYFFFNSPLVCAIACVLAKATGKPIIIEKPKTNLKSKAVIVDYRILKTAS